MARSARITFQLFVTVHVLSAAFVMCLVSNSLFEVNEHDGGTCDGECELSMSCWMGGGVVEPVGNCHSIFRVTIHDFISCNIFMSLFKKMASGLRFTRLYHNLIF